MATTTKKNGIGSTLAIKLGSGTCNILNSFRNMSDDYKTYYANKPNKSLADTAFNIANEVARFGVKTLADIGKGVGELFDEVKKDKELNEIGSDIKNLYKTAREKYGNYLDKTAEKLEADKADPKKSKFFTGFKSFINGTLQTIDNVYEKGVQFAKSAFERFSEGISNISSGVKESKAYKELMREDAQAKATETAEATTEAENGEEMSKT